MAIIIMIIIKIIKSSYVHTKLNVRRINKEKNECKFIRVFA